MSKFREMVEQIEDIVDCLKLIGYKVIISESIYGDLIYINTYEKGIGYVYISDDERYQFTLGSEINVIESTIEELRKKLIELL